MNPQLQSYYDRYSEARAFIVELQDTITAEVAQQRPAENAWSIAEVFEHLCIVGKLILPRIDVGIEEALAHGWLSKGPFKYPAMSRMFIRALSPLKHPRQRPMRVPRMYRPEEHLPFSVVAERFADLQREYMERCENADGLDLGRVAMSSPVTPMIRLRLGAWFESVAIHQERHFGQVYRILDALGVREAEAS